jgi:hypothetical protein
MSRFLETAAGTVASGVVLALVLVLVARALIALSGG